MPAQQGEEYRIIAPRAPEGGRLPYVNGVQISIDQYTSTFTDATGKQLVVTDLVGDVIKASANVAYPRGTINDYRNLQWIDENPDRFELIVAEPEPEPEPESQPE